MSESKHNVTALLAKTFPTFPPSNRIGDVGIKMVVDKKLHVFFVLPGEAPDPEQLAAHAEMGAKRNLPAQLVLEVGQPLPDELLDVVFLFVIAWVDAKSNPQSPRMGQMQLNGEIRRYDYREFLKNAEAALPEEQRIVAPGRPLKVV